MVRAIANLEPYKTWRSGSRVLADKDTGGGTSDKNSSAIFGVRLK